MTMFSCREIVCLASASLDRDLLLRQRLALRVHLLMCPCCARFQRHLLFLNHAARHLADHAARGNVEQAGLSVGVRDRMKRALAQNHS